jgi:hypothetical protein
VLGWILPNPVPKSRLNTQVWASKSVLAQRPLRRLLLLAAMM